MSLSINPNRSQSNGLNELRYNWKKNRTFLVYAPTGAGKTGLAAFIVDGFISRGMRVLFSVPYTTLINQTATRFVEYGIPADQISYIWRDHPMYDPEKLVQIASADTLIRRKFPDNIDLLIVDEAHIRRKALLETIRDTEIKVVGLSGTPFAPWMGKYYEKLVKPTTMKELIRIGDLSPYEFYAPDRPDVSRVKTSNLAAFGRDYNEEQLAQIMGDSTLVGNIVRNWLERGEDRPTICFCVNVKHANYVTMEFNRAGVNAEVMTADTPHEDRQLIIGRFETGATKIIVNVGVLVAGFDSDVRCIIYARPTQSEIRWVQCLGRGLRTARGKDKCLIFDHSGSVHMLGFPDEIEYEELPDTSDGMKQQGSSFREEKPEKKPKECPSCHYMKPAGVYVCPKCGFRPLMGENVDVDESRGLKKLGKGGKIYSREDKQSWWSQIKFYQKQRQSTGKPVSDGWCSHTFRHKFGVWPKGLHDMPQELSPEVSNFIRSRQIAWAKVQEKQTPEADPEQGHVEFAQQQVQQMREQLSMRSGNENSRGGAGAVA